MDIKEMMAAIDAKVNTDAENKQAEEERIAEKAREDIRKILALCPSICELEKVVDALLSRGLVKRGTGVFSGVDFIANGWDHALGFKGDPYWECSRTENWFGAEGGGCSGASVFVDYINGCFIVNETCVSEPELVSLAIGKYSVRSKLDTIANYFHQYRERVENFVKALGK